MWITEGSLLGNSFTRSKLLLACGPDYRRLDGPSAEDLRPSPCLSAQHQFLPAAALAGVTRVCFPVPQGIRCGLVGSLGQEL